jgi:GDP-D-mannose dehydratase
VTDIADSTNKIMIAEGVVTVRTRLFIAATGTIDLRTAKQILDAIDATLLNAATSDQLSYEISTPAGTRKISKMSRVELLDAMQIIRRHRRP